VPTPPDTAAHLGRARGRVVIAFAAFSLGLFVARTFPTIPSLTWFSIAAALCAAAIVTKDWPCRACMIACVASLAAGWFALRAYEPPPDSLAVLLAGDADAHERQLITVEGTVLDDPHASARAAGALSHFAISQPRIRFDLDTDKLIADHALPVRGKLWVRISVPRQDGKIDIRAGDHVRLTGVFTTVDPPMNPGEDDLSLYANEVGYAGSLTLTDQRLLEVLPQPTTFVATYRSAWLRWRASLEARAREIVTRASGSPEGDPGRALLLGLVLGDYDPSQHEVRDAFARQGLAHILSISGFHLSVMALLALMVLRLTGDRGWLEPVIVAALILAYLLIVPPSSPILRSAFMVLILLAAEASGRRYDRLTLLGWIAIGLLIWRPLDLWSIGFQLSLGLTAALFWLGNTFNARMWRQPLKGTIHRETTIPQRILDHLKQSVSTGVMCWALSAPLIACRIGILSPLAIAATIIVTPLIILILWVGYIALLVGVFIPEAADGAGHILAHLSDWSARTVQLFDSMPLSAIRLPVIPPLLAAAATILSAYWLRWGHARDRKAWLATAALTLWLSFSLLSPSLPRNTALRIDTLSVGNGTCHLIRSGDDAMLWDCGSMTSGGVQPALVSTVRALGAWRTPKVVITHPDLDHFGGLPEVLEPLGVRDVYLCERFANQANEQPRGSAAALIHELTRRNISIHIIAAGDQLTLGESTLTFLSPPHNADWKLDNDNSLVARIDIDPQPNAKPALLMTGDIQDQSIAALEATYPDLHPRALELPHHGSAHQAAIQFTQRLNPQVVLQSTGALRLNDPRWAEARQGRLWYTTAHCGAAWVEFNHDGEITSGSFR
jgi:competence protein ComEC